MPERRGRVLVRTEDRQTPKKQVEATVTNQERKTACTLGRTSLQQAVICWRECAVGVCRVLQSQCRCQEIQMHRHHIRFHNPVQYT